MSSLKFLVIATGVALLLILLIDATHSQFTSFVDKDSKLVGFAEPGWFKDNIPFVEVPDKNIEDVYYYRWSSLKRHLRYTTPGAGFIITEFVHNSWYAGKFGTINAAAGHHIYEARWLRDRRYLRDYINFWARQGIHTGNDQYSEWIADASYKAYLLNADADFIKSQQTGLINNYERWTSSAFNPTLGLFFISPHDDAQEQSASSIQTSDPYRGGLGYRPSFNSEMYANARAIAAIARLNGDQETALDFDNRATQLRAAILRHLWDEERTFFYHMQRLDNPNNELLDTREEVGFYPWRWGVPDSDPKYEAAWAHLLDTQAFNSVYGPTTAEQRSKWYDGDQVSQCCWWNGNSWPYSTSLTLNSLAAQLHNYNSTSGLNSQTYVDALHKYAITQYKNEVPYVAECHSPNGHHWVCDGFNSSEHYAHSTYTDNVLTELIGIIPTEEDIFEVRPLVQPNWAYFIAENVPYHGHFITVLYDADGTYYNTGYSGMQVYVNGGLAGSRPGIGPLRVPIPPPAQVPKPGSKLENYAANPMWAGYPEPTASFTHERASTTWHAVDGRIFYDYVPSNRWSNYDSGNEEDWFAINFGPGRAKAISQVKLYVYSDVVTGEGRTDCPKSMRVEIWSQNGEWVPASGQTPIPALCVPNDVNTINFLPVRTERVRIIFTRDVANDYYVGVTEIEIWAPFPQALDGAFEAEDGFLTGGAEIKRGTSAKGNSYASASGPEGDAAVEFLGIYVEQDGNYNLRVFYANGGTQISNASLTVNNHVYSTVMLPPTGNGWGEFHEDSYVTLTLPFQRGDNNIIFKRDEGPFELDAIKLN